MRTWETAIRLRSLKGPWWTLPPWQQLHCLLNEALSCALVRLPLSFRTKSCFSCSAYPFPTTITNSQPAITKHLFFSFSCAILFQPCYTSAVSRSKNHGFLARPLGFRWPKQFCICQRRGLFSTATRQGTGLSDSVQSCASDVVWKHFSC